MLSVQSCSLLLYFEVVNIDRQLLITSFLLFMNFFVGVRSPAKDKVSFAPLVI